MRKPFSSNSFCLLILRKITNSVTKITIYLHGRKSDIIFLSYVLDLIHLLDQNFLSRFQSEGINEAWISQVRRVKRIEMWLQKGFGPVMECPICIATKIYVCYRQEKLWKNSWKKHLLFDGWSLFYWEKNCLKVS